jgi:catechol 2,3-dioxygenase-like lactoylglutathione lyase family enzyme
MEGTTPSETATTSWAKRIFAITLFVDDLAEAKQFYGDIFQMRVLNEDDTSIAFGFPGMVVNLLTVAAAPELIEPAIVGQHGTPSRMMLTLEVEDVDTVCERLRGRGVAFLNGPLDRPWGPRTATFADPSGHCWELSS